MLISVPKGNPYLGNWFNPSIWVEHGLVSVMDKFNMISNVAQRRCSGTEPGNSCNSRNNPKCQVCLSRQLLSHLLTEACQDLHDGRKQTTFGADTEAK